MVRGKGAEGGPEEIHSKVCDGLDRGVRCRYPKLAPSEVHGMDGRETDEAPDRAGDLGATGGGRGVMRGGRGGEAREGGRVEEPEGGAGEVGDGVREGSLDGVADGDCHRAVPKGV
jgi:hypothetical protein